LKTKFLTSTHLLYYPLTTEMLDKAARDYRLVLNQLNLACPEAYGFMERYRHRKIYVTKRSMLDGDPYAWLLTTIWFLAEAETRSFVGEIGFKGPPTMGEIEVGYGLLQSFRNRGLMTEALNTMLLLAVRQQDYHIRTIIAKTLPDNLPSQSVLRKCDFQLDRRQGKYLVWKRNTEGLS
jgi:predicted acetyltransferase